MRVYAEAESRGNTSVAMLIIPWRKLETMHNMSKKKTKQKKNPSGTREYSVLLFNQFLKD